MQPFDQHGLDLVACSLRADATSLQQAHAVLLAEAAGLSWHSPAARVFEAALHTALAELRRFTTRLDELALMAVQMCDRLSRVDHRLAHLTGRLLHNPTPAVTHRNRMAAR